MSWAKLTLWKYVGKVVRVVTGGAQQVFGTLVGTDDDVIVVRDAIVKLFEIDEFFDPVEAVKDKGRKDVHAECLIPQATVVSVSLYHRPESSQKPKKPKQARRLGIRSKKHHRGLQVEISAGARHWINSESVERLHYGINDQIDQICDRLGLPTPPVQFGPTRGRYDFKLTLHGKTLVVGRFPPGSSFVYCHPGQSIPSEANSHSCPKVGWPAGWWVPVEEQAHWVERGHLSANYWELFGALTRNSLAQHRRDLISFPGILRQIQALSPPYFSLMNLLDFKLTKPIHLHRLFKAIAQANLPLLPLPRILEELNTFPKKLDLSEPDLVVDRLAEFLVLDFFSAREEADGQPIFISLTSLALKRFQSSNPNVVEEAANELEASVDPERLSDRWGRPPLILVTPPSESLDLRRRLPGQPFVVIPEGERFRHCRQFLQVQTI